MTPTLNYVDTSLLRVAYQEWNPQASRTGQLAALGRDLLEFIDALDLNQPALVGHDWVRVLWRLPAACAGRVAVSMERLSSGMRVNGAKDDAAGWAIAERMDAQTRGQTT